MNKITADLLLGEIEEVFWIDEDFSMIFFKNDGSGSIYTEKNNLEEELFFSWKINDNGVLALNFEKHENKLIFWKLTTTIDKEDSIYLIIQEYEKLDSSKKPTKTKEKKLYSKPSVEIESKIKEDNISILKSLISDYNVWNYSVISAIFLIFFLFVYIIINFIVIVKDFPFLFQLFLILISTIFVIRPLFFFANKISYKIRYWIEKN